MKKCKWLALVLVFAVLILPASLVSAPTNDFDDVPEDHWAAENIANVVQKRLMQGVGGSMFDPDGILTRAQVAQVIFNAYGGHVAASEGHFADVSEAAWYFDAIMWVHSNGLSEVSRGNFYPHEPATREVVAEMLHRTAISQNVVLPLANPIIFADMHEIEFWPAVTALQQAGIISGFPDGTFGPRLNVTRAQMARMIDMFTDMPDLIPDENRITALMLPTESTAEEPFVEEEPAQNIATITIAAAGDTTLGGDSRWAGYGAFMREYNANGLEHFFYNVRDIFAESDLSIVNLEGVLTNITEPHMDKQFVFRGPPHFARILTYGNVDVVTIANNHTIDFFDAGMADTRQALTNEGIAYFGNEFTRIVEVEGVKVGLFGFRIWADNQHNRNLITGAIDDLNAAGAQLIIAYHHWGPENVNMPVQYQISMGRFTIDQGAHLVLGAHAHVLQGIEIYNGRNIVYGLANFSFGGNSNPTDQDTMIFQQTFTFVEGELVADNETNIIPARISSVRGRNNFQPTPAAGDDAERILQRIRTYSSWLNN